MSPLPFWLVGAQSVVLNMSNNDQPLHLHYALFNGTQGYRLKPPEMMRPVLSKANASFRDHEEVRTSGGTDLRRSASTSSVQCRHSASTRQSDYRRSEVSHAESATDGADETRRQSNDEDYWPPPRDRLHRCTLEIISLHNLPKCREQRPRFDGSRSACHLYVPELSGAAAPPDGAAAVSSSLKLHFSVHPIGGFCAISKTLPLPHEIETDVEVHAPKGDRVNVSFGENIHCVAAEPHATFLHMSVVDGVKEVAYDCFVLGRLRRGYRVIQMRSSLGTRIELCYLLVCFSFGCEVQLWSTPRHLRLKDSIDEARQQSDADEHSMLNEKVRDLEQQLHQLRESVRSVCAV